MTDTTLEFGYEIPPELFEQAASRLESLDQAAELANRREMEKLNDLFNRISSEVVAGLNRSNVGPDQPELVMQLIKDVFEKYFGKGARVSIEKIEGEEAFRVTSTLELGR